MNNRKFINIEMDDETARKFRIVAAEAGVSPTKFARQLVLAAVAKRFPAEADGKPSKTR